MCKTLARGEGCTDTSASVRHCVRGGVCGERESEKNSSQSQRGDAFDETKAPESSSETELSGASEKG